MSALFWIIIALTCAVLDLALSSFRFIWLAVAGLLTALVVKAGLLPAISSQILFFVIASGLMLLLVRPVAIRYIKKQQDRP